MKWSETWRVGTQAGSGTKYGQRKMQALAIVCTMAVCLSQQRTWRGCQGNPLHSKMEKGRETALLKLLQRPLCPFQWQGQLQGKTRIHGTTDQANHQTAGRMSLQLGNRHGGPESGPASVAGWELGSYQPGPASSTGCHTLSLHIFHPRWSRGRRSRICTWACRARCWWRSGALWAGRRWGLGRRWCQCLSWGSVSAMHNCKMINWGAARGAVTGKKRIKKTPALTLLHVDMQNSHLVKFVSNLEHVLHFIKRTEIENSIPKEKELVYFFLLAGHWSCCCTPTNKSKKAPHAKATYPPWWLTENSRHTDEYR